jgi:hypothetical protein
LGPALKGDNYKNTKYTMAEPYPFYDKLPQSFDDVKEYLTTWLQAITPPSIVMYDDVAWSQTFGFKRGFGTHGVFTSSNGAFAFHVGEDGDMQNFPNFGTYESFDKMIDGVGKRYCQIWKIQIEE